MSINWPSFKAFLACQTQWRVLASQVGLIWIGLDYPACQIVLADQGAAAGIFSDLQVMETAALAILNQGGA